MKRSLKAAVLGMLFTGAMSAALALDGVVVAVPARAGAVDGTDQNSDEFIWNLLVQFAAPATEGKAPSLPPLLPPQPAALNPPKTTNPTPAASRRPARR